MKGRPLVPRPAAVWLALLLSACGPGSGGSGVPTAALPDDGAAAAPAPVVAPGTCAVPAGATTADYAGTVQWVSDNCLATAERAILITDAIVVRRSGVVARIADLAPGQSVTITPEPTDPGRARTIVIEDVARSVATPGS